MDAILIVLGLTALVGGAELLVSGASRLAAAAGIPPLIIGLTVVAFGTSAPELAVSVNAALGGQADIALGNVVGSNSFNILVILGLSALIIPLSVDRQLIRLDVPVMIGVSVVLWLMALDGGISSIEGLVLFSGIIVYLVFLFYLSRMRGAALAHNAGESELPGSAWSALVKVVAGLALLVFGSYLLVTGAVGLARGLGVSELVIGLTIVAAGTSLPEVFTSVVGALRGQRDIAVGNVVGSNIFNILAVLGLSSALSGGGIRVPAAALNLDLPLMTAAAVACLPIFFTRLEISRREGALFLAYYLGYTSYLVATAARSPAEPLLRGLALWIVLPATVLVLLVSLIRSMRTGPLRRNIE